MELTKPVDLRLTVLKDGNGGVLVRIPPRMHIAMALVAAGLVGCITAFLILMLGGSSGAGASVLLSIGIAFCAAALTAIVRLALRWQSIRIADSGVKVQGGMWMTHWKTIPAPSIKDVQPALQYHDETRPSAFAVVMTTIDRKQVHLARELNKREAVWLADAAASILGSNTAVASRDLSPPPTDFVDDAKAIVDSAERAGYSVRLNEELPSIVLEPHRLPVAEVVILGFAFGAFSIWRGNGIVQLLSGSAHGSASAAFAVLDLVVLAGLLASLLVLLLQRTEVVVVPGAVYLKWRLLVTGTLKTTIYTRETTEDIEVVDADDDRWAHAKSCLRFVSAQKAVKLPLWNEQFRDDMCSFLLQHVVAPRGGKPAWRDPR